MQREKQLEDSIAQKRFISEGTRKILSIQGKQIPIQYRLEEITENKSKRLQDMQTKLKQISEADLTFQPKTNRSRSAMSYDNPENNSLSLVKRTQLWNNRKQSKIEQRQAERERKESQMKEAI